MSPSKTVSSGAPVRVAEQPQLAIHVVFTSDRETVAALRHAAGLAAGLNASLLIVAPQLVPWAAEIDRPPVNPEFTAARILRIAAEAGVETGVHVVLCRDRMVGLESVLGNQIVVIAGDEKLAN